jgi:hypothetical protein
MKDGTNAAGVSNIAGHCRRSEAPGKGEATKVNQ